MFEGLQRAIDSIEHHKGNVFAQSRAAVAASSVLVRYVGCATLASMREAECAKPGSISNLVKLVDEVIVHHDSITDGAWAKVVELASERVGLVGPGVPSQKLSVLLRSLTGQRNAYAHDCAIISQEREEAFFRRMKDTLDYTINEASSILTVCPAEFSPFVAYTSFGQRNEVMDWAVVGAIDAGLRITYKSLATSFVKKTETQCDIFGSLHA